MGAVIRGRIRILWLCFIGTPVFMFGLGWDGEAVEYTFRNGIICYDAVDYKIYIYDPNSNSLKWLMRCVTMI